jgi:Flp pilus assembly protein CpaB
MKGVPGILIAIGLGLAGAICNWFYLERLAGQEAKEVFIGIKAGTQLNAGDVIREEHLIPIGIPRSALGNLDQVAPIWKFRGAVVGLSTNRSFRGGELVLQDDVKSPGQRDLNEKLGPDEVAVWIPVDPRTFNAGRVNPNDEVSFLIPRSGGASPTPLGEEAPAVIQNTGGQEILGPFRILEIGSRTGRPEVQKAAGARTGNEASITVVAKLQNGKLEPKALRLTDLVRSTRAQGLQVLLHAKKK